ncbi:MAG: hypothetical protein HKN44_12880 [Ilumatobacter sp.]|nr:hypothetical protein [Ilumatobacter sp.]
MGTTRALAVSAAMAIGLVACASDDGRIAEQPIGPSNEPAATAPVGAAPLTPASARPESAPVARQVVLAQPAIWPAPDVVFTTPDEAAADFVTKVLGVAPVLGEFQRGDSLSGEIEVFSASEDGTSRLLRGVLFLRQIMPTEGWYVIGAASDGITIASPVTLAEVPAGPLDVTGAGRGFETTLNVIAFAAGDADARLDLEIAAGGAFEQLEPYEATLDLSAASPGDVVAILVRGDTGLGTDPGEFAAIPIVIAQRLPELR